ncbi:hypothetical protein FPV67DRAFT_1449165 [Lyophyllum atratum]|nr:hypothetical protein FPV67DRAFT_1449165 [Lyophyllum atratum]
MTGCGARKLLLLLRGNMVRNGYTSWRCACQSKDVWKFASTRVARYIWLDDMTLNDADGAAGAGDQDNEATDVEFGSLPELSSSRRLHQSARDIHPRNGRRRSISQGALATCKPSFHSRSSTLPCSIGGASFELKPLLVDQAKSVSALSASTDAETRTCNHSFPAAASGTKPDDVGLCEIFKFGFRLGHEGGGDGESKGAREFSCKCVDVVKRHRILKMQYTSVNEESTPTKVFRVRTSSAAMAARIPGSAGEAEWRPIPSWARTPVDPERDGDREGKQAWVPRRGEKWRIDWRPRRAAGSIAGCGGPLIVSQPKAVPPHDTLPSASGA